MSEAKNPRLITLAWLLAALLGVSPLEAQRWPFGESRRAAETVDFSQFNIPYNGRFTFVRLRFTPQRTGWGSGGYFGGNYWWDHDYPRAERHFTRMLSELTALIPNTEGNAGNILALDDPDLFKYPIAYMSEPGYWAMNEAEVEALRNYLLKGGFVIFDDFSGSDWFNFEEQMRRVLPDHGLVRLDASHPIFHSFFEIETLDHFVHPYRGVRSLFYGVFEDDDPGKRLMLIVNYNNDIGESWEWSDTGFIPIDLTNDAYELGINYIVYAMTH